MIYQVFPIQIHYFLSVSKQVLTNRLLHIVNRIKITKFACLVANVIEYQSFAVLK